MHLYIISEKVIRNSDIRECRDRHTERILVLLVTWFTGYLVVQLVGSN
jgi:hypothetical protein